jgi:hypothetical protein
MDKRYGYRSIVPNPLNYDPNKYRLYTDDLGLWVEIRPELFNSYKASTRMQLLFWLFGRSIHLDYWDQCCPDGSCCGETIWDVKKRLKYFKASDLEQISMIMHF